MIQFEFEALYGHKVSNHDYHNIIEPMYMATGLSKSEFVKLLDKKAFKAPETKKTIKKMLVRDASGCRKTPNGCYYHINYVELVDVDIATGKFIIKPLADEDLDKLATTHDIWNCTSYDFDYTDCLTTKHKPVEIN